MIFGYRNCLLSVLSALSLSLTAWAAPVFNPWTGNYYERIDQTGLTWDQARAAAESRSYRGAQGHLVTITDAQEQQFIESNLGAGIGSWNIGYWAGGYQVSPHTGPADNWQWVTGEPWGYTNWITGEPNDRGLQDENTLHLLGDHNWGWNDELSGSLHRKGGYFVEYPTTPGNYVPPPQPDPVDPPQHTSQYNFVIGAQPYFLWDGITVGIDFSLSVPTMDPITYNPSITYPSEPFTPELEPWEIPFGTNSWWLGPALKAVAPLEFNAITLTGTARLSADAVAEAGIYLEDGENHADIGASIGAGLNLGLTLTATNDLLEALPDVIQDMIPNTFSFTYPIVGTPTFETPDVPVSLGLNFDIDTFRDNLSTLTGDSLESIVGAYGGAGVPMTFSDLDGDDIPDEVSITIGASASAYAETSATAGLDVYFREVDSEGNPVGGTSIFDTWGNIWNQVVDVAEEVVSTSETGTIVFNEDGSVSWETGSPVWMSTVVEVTELTNLVAFEAEFTSEEGAEGLLQIYWDDELIATIDERMAGDGLDSYIFVLPESYEDGFHQLAFRLDPFTEVASSMNIDRITTGFLVAIPEPSTFALLTLSIIIFLPRGVQKRSGS